MQLVLYCPVITIQPQDILWTGVDGKADDGELKSFGLLAGMFGGGLFVNDHAATQRWPVQVARKPVKEVQGADLYSAADKIGVDTGRRLRSPVFPQTQQFIMQIRLVAFQFEQPVAVFF